MDDLTEEEGRDRPGSSAHSWIARSSRSCASFEHANTYPEKLIEQMKQLGIFGLVVPEPFSDGLGFALHASR